MDEVDINARIELTEVTGMCDPELDEHPEYHYTGETRFNKNDQTTEVRKACQCDLRELWVPEGAARNDGYTG